MSIYDEELDEGTEVGSMTDVEERAKEILDMDYDSFTKSDDYASLAKRYSSQGRQAMDDTIGMMAARTGGLASSYAAIAGQQTYNDYMSRLEDAARAMYDDQRQEKIDNLSISQGIYDRKYDEFVNNRTFEYEKDQKKKTEDENNLYADIYYGGTPDYDAYVDEGGLLDKASYDRIVKSAQEALKYKETIETTKRQEENADIIRMHLASGKSIDEIANMHIGRDSGRDLIEDSGRSVYWWRAYESSPLTNGDSLGVTPAITDPDEIYAWQSLILSSKTADEALCYLSNLALLDANLAQSFSEQWEKKYETDLDFEVQ